MRSVFIVSFHVFTNKPCQPWRSYQADVCHAYQLLRKGGLKDENIIVFMYDDIAYNEENPRQGVIINSPAGEDVYKGVPKVVVFLSCFSVYLNHTLVSCAISWGRIILEMMLMWTTFWPFSLVTKLLLLEVVERWWSGPNDHIFIFYSDHGGPGVLGK